MWLSRLRFINRRLSKSCIVFYRIKEVICLLFVIFSYAYLRGLCVVLWTARQLDNGGNFLGDDCPYFIYVIGCFASPRLLGVLLVVDGKITLASWRWVQIFNYYTRSQA